MTFDSDAGWTHERLVLATVDEHRAVICTGDGDLYESGLGSCDHPCLRRRSPSASCRGRRRSTTICASSGAFSNCSSRPQDRDLDHSNPRPVAASQRRSLPSAGSSSSPARVQRLDQTVKLPHPAKKTESAGDQPKGPHAGLDLQAGSSSQLGDQESSGTSCRSSDLPGESVTRTTSRITTGARDETAPRIAVIPIASVPGQRQLEPSRATEYHNEHFRVTHCNTAHVMVSFFLLLSQPRVHKMRTPCRDVRTDCGGMRWEAKERERPSDTSLSSAMCPKIGTCSMCGSPRHATSSDTTALSMQRSAPRNRRRSPREGLRLKEHPMIERRHQHFSKSCSRSTHHVCRGPTL